jgi:hypothetical protein
MPFNTIYSHNINNRLNRIYKNHIDNEDRINDNEMKDKREILGELEHSAKDKKTLHGGDHVDATLHDIGYEKTKTDDVKPIRKKKESITEQRLIDGQGLGGLMVGEGLSAGGMSAGGLSAGAKKRPRKKKEVSIATVIENPSNDNEQIDVHSDDVGAGLSAGSKKPRKSKKKMQGGDLKDVIETVGSVAKTIAPFAPLLLGLGKDDGHKKRSDIVKEVMNQKNISLIEASKLVKSEGLYKPKAKEPKEPKEKKPSSGRAAIVKQIMEEKKMSLPDASKYVKENNLYKPLKGGTLLTLKSADSQIGDTIGPVSIVTGNVKPLKGRGKAKPKA